MHQIGQDNLFNKFTPRQPILLPDDAICIVDKRSRPGKGHVGLGSHIRTPKNRGLPLRKVQLQYMKRDIHIIFSFIVIIIIMFNFTDKQSDTGT